MQTSINNANENVNEITYAGFLVRFVAFIIDMIVVGIGVSFIKVFVLSGFLSIEVFSNPILFNISIADIFTYILKVSYFIICVCSTQTTLGKYIMKLKVVDKDGGKLSALSVIYRETIGRFLSSFLCAGYLLVLIDKEKTALHDKIVDSRVIYSCNVKKTVFVRQQYAAPPVNAMYQQGNRPMNGNMPYPQGSRPMNQNMPPQVIQPMNQNMPPQGGQPMNQNVPPQGGQPTDQNMPPHVVQSENQNVPQSDSRQDVSGEE